MGTCHTLYSFSSNKCCQDLSYGSGYALIICPMGSWKECVFAVVRERIFCPLGPIGWGCVKFFCILADFLFVLSSVVEEGVLKSPTVTVDLFLFFTSIWFWFTYSAASLWKECMITMSFWWTETLSMCKFMPTLCNDL